MCYPLNWAAFLAYSSNGGAGYMELLRYMMMMFLNFLPLEGKEGQESQEIQVLVSRDDAFKYALIKGDHYAGNRQQRWSAGLMNESDYHR